MNNIKVTYDLIESPEVDQLIKQNPKLDTIINESLHFNLDIDQVTFYTVPLWAEQEATRLLKEPLVINFNSNYCFNFLINKKQLNRYYLIKFVEWFKLTNFNYTWSGIGRTTDLSNELNDIDRHFADPDFKYHLLRGIDLPEKFIKITTAVQDEVNNNVAVYKYGDNRDVWHKVLQPMLSETVVSLITESVRNEKTAHITEKTLFAVLAHTFPIWVGGYGQADAWKNTGFDVFDDIIDHSYQYQDTLVQRCYLAIKNNLKILTDIEYAQNLRQQNQDRLLANQENLIKNLKNFNINTIKTFPAHVQAILMDIRCREYKLDL